MANPLFSEGCCESFDGFGRMFFSGLSSGLSHRGLRAEKGFQEACYKVSVQVFAARACWS